MSERPRPSRSDTMRTTRNDGGRRDAPRRRQGSDEDIDDYADELYDMYQPRSSRNGYTRSRQGKSSRPQYIDEEEEDDYDGSDMDDAEFEMVSRSKTRRRSPARSNTSRRSDRERERDRDTGSKIRVKVHAGDTRYVFITQNTVMREFVQQIRDKFGIRQNFKVEIRDDDDMITMADQDDLDMAIQSARSMARKENSDMPKMEVCLNLFPPFQFSNSTMLPPLYPSISVKSACRQKRWG
jgi:hypothetical protein